MKGLKNLKELSKILELLDNDCTKLMLKINNEYKNNIKLERNILLKQISIDYDLDYEKMLEQYVYKKKTNAIILNLKKVNGIECFFHETEDSDVYDEDSNIVGKFINNNIVLTEL